MRPAADGEVDVQLRSRDGAQVGPVRRFSVRAGEPVGLSLGLPDVDAALIAPAGTLVCRTGE
jgi:hypothetical protein